MWVLVLGFGTGQWAHALVTPSAPRAEHCASHDTLTSKALPVHTTECCKVDAGGCFCAAALVVSSLPTVFAFHTSGFVPVVFAVQPPSADPTAVFRPPI